MHLAIGLRFENVEHLYNVMLEEYRKFSQRCWGVMPSTEHLILSLLSFNRIRSAYQLLIYRCCWLFRAFVMLYQLSVFSMCQSVFVMFHLGWGTSECACSELEWTLTQQFIHCTVAVYRSAVVIGCYGDSSSRDLPGLKLGGIVSMTVTSCALMCYKQVCFVCTEMPFPFAKLCSKTFWIITTWTRQNSLRIFSEPSTCEFNSHLCAEDRGIRQLDEETIRRTLMA